MQPKKHMKRYVVELSGSMLIYSVLLVSASFFGRAIQPEPWHSLALASPMIGFCLMLWAIARQIIRSDEYQRKLQVENFALAAALVVGLSFTYGFLENAGYPRLSMFTVCEAMVVSLVIISIVRGTCWR